MEKEKRLLRVHLRDKHALLAFGLVFGLALVMFLPFLLTTHGYFTYYGDFNAQQISFYRLAHDAVRAGEWGFNWNTDLGVNFIGSYSFYLLGSPFFWLTIPFPSAAVPYMMAPLLILKMSLMSLGAYLYLKRFVKAEYAVLGAILYAFSGFSIYNIFFNHFHEAMVYLPFILLGLERHLKDGKHGMFGIFIFLSAINNYYFFIGQAIFLLIYFVIRAWSGEWQLNAKKVVGVFLEAALGTCAAGVLLLPSFFAVIQNNRTGNLVAGWDALYYTKPQRLWDILHSFFFPPDIPARPNFFPDADNKWSSMSAWLPMVGATGAIAYFQYKSHKDWLHRLLIVLAVCAIIPIFNAAFQLFNSQYYARWFYMFTLMLIVATVKALEDSEPREDGGATPVHWGRAFGWSAGVIVFFTVMVGLIPNNWKPEDGNYVFGRENTPEMFWAYVVIALIGLVAFAVMLFLRKRAKETFFRWTALTLSVLCLGYSWVMMGQGHGVSVYVPEFVVQRAIEGIDKVHLPTDATGEFVRLDSPDCIDNLGIYWERPCINAFHSIVPGSVQEFYGTIGIQRSVGSRPETEHYALRSLTSVRYVVDYSNKEEPRYQKASDKYFADSSSQTKMPGYHYVTDTNGFFVYENENYIPMGFTYQSYVTRTEYESLSTADRELLLLRALVVENEDEYKVSAYLKHLDVTLQGFSYERFVLDCRDRQAGAATDFKTNKHGFTASATLNEDNLLFFSVPFEKGWSATVNGKPVNILKADAGFMAVPCSAGVCEVEFTYKTPGLAGGAVATLGGAAALALFVIFWGKVPDSWLKKKTKKRDNPEIETEKAVEEKPFTP